MADLPRSIGVLAMTVMGGTPVPPPAFPLPPGEVLKAILRPELRSKVCISAKKSLRLLSIIAQLMHFRVKAVFFTGHFVIVAFVFMHIAGSIFIFNISKGKRPVPDPDGQVGEPPNLPKAGIFHLRGLVA